jgi:hypothetical protein
MLISDAEKRTSDSEMIILDAERRTSDAEMDLPDSEKSAPDAGELLSDAVKLTPDAEAFISASERRRFASKKRSVASEMGSLRLYHPQTPASSLCRESFEMGSRAVQRYSASNRNDPGAGESILIRYQPSETLPPREARFIRRNS